MAKIPKVGLDRDIRFVNTSAVTVDDLREIAPILRGEIIKFQRKVAKEEADKQFQANNPLSGVEIDGKIIVKGRGGPGQFEKGAVHQIIDNSTRRVRLFYQADMSILRDALQQAWITILAKTPRLTGEARRTFYCRGKADGKFTGQMSLPQALVWVMKQTDIETRVFIEGPQTPYRRKLIYLYGNPRYRSGSKKGQRRREKLDERRIWHGKNGKIFIETGGSDIRYVGGVRLIPGRHRERYEAYGYKAYIKTIAQSLKRQYRDLIVGYRFVKSYEGLKPYPSSTGMRPWGNFLPQVYIGLKPGRRS
jgi:hypothetical protein